MESNHKLEKQFKDQLNTREIQPSPMAWDRLDAMLTVAENKKPKRKLGWLFFAASFVGILFTGFLVYQLNLNNNQTNNIVEMDNIEKNKSTEINIKPVIAATVFEPEKVVKTSKINVTKAKTTNQNLVSIEQIISQKTQENKTEYIKIKSNADVSKSSIIVNPEPILAQIETSKTQSLPNPIKVNPNSLLSEVDGEITQEFRESKFSKLKRNFESVKSALTARNDK